MMWAQRALLPLVLFLSACASLPPPVEREASYAYEDTDTTQLAQALQDFPRRLQASVPADNWPQLHARLAAWAESGHLAAYAPARKDDGDVVHSFCFSGLPLFHRAPLMRGSDGIDVVHLDASDRTALGWFSMEVSVRASAQAAFEAPVSSGAIRGEELVEILGLEPAEQLELDLGGSFDDSSYQEKSA